MSKCLNTTIKTHSFLQQECFCLFQSLFHVSSHLGKHLPLFYHLCLGFGEFCHCCLDFLGLKWETFNAHFLLLPNPQERRLTSSRARCSDAISPNAFISFNRFAEMSWKRKSLNFCLLLSPHDPWHEAEEIKGKYHDFFPLVLVLLCSFSDSFGWNWKLPLAQSLRQDEVTSGSTFTRVHLCCH